MPALELALAMLVLFVGLLVLQPDMGQTIIVTCVWCGLFFLSGYCSASRPCFWSCSWRASPRPTSPCPIS